MIRAIEAERAAALAADPHDDTGREIEALCRIRGIGETSATVLAREVLDRRFTNRRHSPIYVGLPDALPEREHGPGSADRPRASRRDHPSGGRPGRCRGHPRTGRLARCQDPAGARDLTLLPLPPYPPGAEPGREPLAISQAQHPDVRVLADHQPIVDACCDAWNRLRAIPARSAPSPADHGQEQSISTTVGITCLRHGGCRTRSCRLPPSAGAYRLARHDRACARLAANRGIALRHQRV